MYKSPIKVILKESKEAAPIPCSKRNHSNKLKSRAKAQAVPAMPNKNSEGTIIFFLPNLSARIPIIGPKIRDGNVNAVINKPKFFGLIFNSLANLGKAGVTLETPRTAISTTAQII